MDAASESRPPVKVHITLYVSAVEPSAVFYEALFGVPAHRRRPGYVEFDLTEPPLRLVLQECAPQGTGPVNHLGVQFATPEPLRAARERLVTAGYVIRELRDTSCRLADCPPRYDTIWVNAPDGCRWELYAELIRDPLDDTQKGEPK